MISLPMILFQILLTTTAATSSNGNIKRVYGGIQAIDGQFPYVILLVINNTNDVGLCTGSLLKFDTVLTAGHCLYGIKEPKNIIAVAGKANAQHFVDFRFGRLPIYKEKTIPYTYFSNSLQERRGKAKIMHPKYKSAGYYDFALLQVDRPFNQTQFVQLVNFTTADLDPKTYCFIMGYGQIAPGITMFSLQYFETTNLNSGNPECSEQDRSKYYHCLGYESKTTCFGDSGAPLMCNGIMYGVLKEGIYQRKTVYCRAPVVSLYSKLSIEKTETFITKYANPTTPVAGASITSGSVICICICIMLIL